MRRFITHSLLALTWLAFGSFAHAAGEVTDGKVTPFLIGEYQNVDAVKKGLKSHGFSILSAKKVDKKGDLTTVVFTSPALIKLGSLPNRGFGAVLRVLVNKIDQQIAITNPLYFEKAYLQKAFDKTAVTAILKPILQAFPKLKNSKENLVFDDLSGYHFMVGMPYYDDRIKVGEGDNAALLKKAKAYKKGENLLFELKLKSGAVLVGYTIGKRTAKFIKKIGIQNAAVLPYTILIQDNAAYILDPKYYLALNYPSLTMSQFMTIATVPGAIEKDCKKTFK
jgi:hypothetical protein